MAGFRLAGQEGALSLLNTTTQDELLPALNLLSIKANFPFELVKREYIGETGPDYREFGDGYELEVEAEPDDADQIAAYLNAITAKAQGKSQDEFAAQMRLASPDGGTLQVTFRDIHWEGLPLDLGSRTDFLKLSLKGKGKVFKVQVI
jgi:hypothetical protein